MSTDTVELVEPSATATSSPTRSSSRKKARSWSTDSMELTAPSSPTRATAGNKSPRLSPRRNKGKKKDEIDADAGDVILEKAAASIVAKAAAATAEVEIADVEVEATTTRTRSRSLSVASASSTSSKSKKKKKTNATPSKPAETTKKDIPKSSGKKKRKLSKGNDDDFESNDGSREEVETKGKSGKKDGKGKAKEGKESNSSNQSKEQKASAVDNALKKTKPPPPIFHANVHRVRDINYIPKPIVCMATYNGKSSRSSSSSYIAIGRDDGCMELMACTTITNSSNTKSTLTYTLGNVPGSINLKPNVIQWVTTSGGVGGSSLPVCVVGSVDGTIYVVNFESKQITSRIACGGGSIYNITTLTSSGIDVGLPIIAVACHDGSTRIYQVMMTASGDNDEAAGGSDPYFELLTTLPSTSSAVLCLSWTTIGNKTADQNVYETALFAGVADGTIRRYNMTVSVGTNSSGSDGSSPSISISKVSPAIRMTCESQGRQFTTTKVWCMEAWDNNSETMANAHSNSSNNDNVTLVTGNSIGRIEIWDGTSGTLQQSIKHNENSADVLCLSTSISTGSSSLSSTSKHRIFASGVDSRVVCIEREVNSTPTATSMGWKLTQAQRPHTHDVKAMAICHLDDGSSEADSSYLKNVLVTGGVDTKLCSYYVTEFAKHRPKIMYPWPNGNMLGTTPIRGIGSCQSSGENGSQTQNATNANNDRIMLVQRATSVDLYQLFSKHEIKAMHKRKKRKASKNLRSVSKKTLSLSTTYPQKCIHRSCMCPLLMREFTRILNC